MRTQSSLVASAHNPSQKVTKRKTIEQNCVACGHHRSVPLVHKLTTYIINHPPSDGSDNTTRSSKYGS
jgi:hypothetical protein